MSRLRVACIVEGQGEVSALPVLLQRIWYELIGGEYIEVVGRPNRQPRNQLAANKNQALERAVQLAAMQVAANNHLNDPTLILVLIDADQDLPCELGPAMLSMAQQARPDRNISCVVAKVMFETWLVGGAETLSGDLDLAGTTIPEDPESAGNGSGWIKHHMKRNTYSKTVDQPRLTAKFDLKLARRRCPSFDKLCRDLERAASA